MGFFNRRKTPAQVGTACGKRLKRILNRIAVDTRNLPDELRVNLARELILLAYTSQRIAIQHGCPDKGTMMAMCGALDRYAAGLIALDQHSDIVSLRGRQYWSMVRSHIDDIRAGDWGTFWEEFSFSFEQFCLGGGGETDPVIIDDVLGTMTRARLALDYWIKGFTETYRYVKSTPLKSPAKGG